MTRRLTGIGIAAGVVLIALAVFAFDQLQHGGRFKNLKPHFAGSCQPLELAASAADARIDHERGVAYLSYLDRRAVATGEDARGTIALLDLGASEPRPRAALASEANRFQPGGIALWAPPDAPRRLFAIDYGDGAPAVQIFEETATGAFAALERIRDPLLLSPAAIAAVGPREFYVANSSGATTPLERLRERLFRAGLSTVTYYDGERMRVVASGLRSAGGIVVSNHGLTVYVSETAAERLRVFDRDSSTGDLAPRNYMDLGSAPEHVTIDAEGTVWIAAHPQLHALRRHLADPTVRSPTAVYRLRVSVVEKQDRLSIPFLDLGDRISAGSVAAVHEDRMLVGSRTQKKALLCRLPERL